MKKKQSKFSTIILVIIFVIGICLLVYPTFSDYWNSFHQSIAIASYAEAVTDMSTAEYDKILGNAHSYNNKLTDSGILWTMTDEEMNEYNSTLDVTGTGIMGYIEIDKIDCSLPIYHGIDDTVLQIAIGHIAGTSLPVGGEGTHTVLSGHRGLPSAKLFTRLDEMQEGDTFVICVLDEVMTYEVDKVTIVEPDDLSPITIEAGKDLVTLVTCTPYGINTHRLLVRGHRIANTVDSSNIKVTSDATQIDPVIVAPIIASVILFVVLVWLLIDTEKNKRARRAENKAKDSFKQ